MEQSGLLDRKLSTGDRILFDKKRRELIVVGAADAAKASDWKAALDLVKSGRARHFDQSALRGMFEAMQGIVLLGA
jgi:hypothetical protein